MLQRPIGAFEREKQLLFDVCQCLARCQRTL